MKYIPFFLILLLQAGCYEVETLEDVRSAAFRPRGDALMTANGHLFIQGSKSYLKVNLTNEFARFAKSTAMGHRLPTESLRWSDYIAGEIPAATDVMYQKVRVIMDWSTLSERDQSRQKMAAVGYAQGDALYLFDFVRGEHRAWMQFRLYSNRFPNVPTDFFVEVPVKVERRLKKSELFR